MNPYDELMDRIKERDEARAQLAEARVLFGRVHYDLCMCGIPSHQMMADYISAFLSRTEAKA